MSTTKHPQAEARAALRDERHAIDLELARLVWRGEAAFIDGLTSEATVRLAPYLRQFAELDDAVLMTQQARLAKAKAAHLTL